MVSSGGVRLDLGFTGMCEGGWSRVVLANWDGHGAWFWEDFSLFVVHSKIPPSFLVV
jgi:hypothetical protein